MNIAPRLRAALVAAVLTGMAAAQAARPPFSGRPPDGRAAAGIRLAATRARSAQGASKLPQLAAPPGRIQLNFGDLNSRAAEVSDISLDGAMLQLGIRMLSAQDSDAAARQVLAQLRGVYVKSFRFDTKDRYSESDLDSIRRQLQAPGWTQILRVRQRDDFREVEVYVMTAAQRTAGMVIIAAYPKQLRVVNLVGPIDPAALGRLGGHFGIPPLPSLRRHR
ncbi:MAG: DUF4252 domain-containing protein [Terriglobales bacterium]